MCTFIVVTEPAEPSKFKWQDEIEIQNPGGLLGSLTTESLFMSLQYTEILNSPTQLDNSATARRQEQELIKSITLLL